MFCTNEHNSKIVPVKSRKDGKGRKDRAWGNSFPARPSVPFSFSSKTEGMRAKVERGGGGAALALPGGDNFPGLFVSPCGFAERRERADAGHRALKRRAGRQDVARRPKSWRAVFGSPVRAGVCGCPCLRRPSRCGWKAFRGEKGGSALFNALGSFRRQRNSCFSTLG